jgi:hypothetical protein
MCEFTTTSHFLLNDPNIKCMHVHQSWGTTLRQSKHVRGAKHSPLVCHVHESRLPVNSVLVTDGDGTSTDPLELPLELLLVDYDALEAAISDALWLWICVGIPTTSARGDLCGRVAVFLEMWGLHVFERRIHAKNGRNGEWDGKLHSHHGGDEAGERQCSPTFHVTFQVYLEPQGSYVIICGAVS